jgi:7-cyano-7-deazaguanine synthase
LSPEIETDRGRTAFYLELGFSLRSIFIDYGQLANAREAAAAEAVARHFGVPLSKVLWSGISGKTHGLIQGRNAFLLLGALLELPDYAGILAVGIHAGTPSLDCGPEFMRDMQCLFDLYTQGRVQIGTPFLKWSKAAIWDFCNTRQVPLDLTYSCECGTDQPCGRCRRQLKDST